MNVKYLINSDNEPMQLIMQMTQQTGTKNGNRIINGIIKTSAPVTLLSNEWVAANLLNLIAAVTYADNLKSNTNATQHHIAIGKISHKYGIIITNITA